MTFLAITGLLNVLVCSFLAFFVLKARTPVARSFGLFSLTVVLWSAAYTVWQCMKTPVSHLFDPWFTTKD